MPQVRLYGSMDDAAAGSPGKSGSVGCGCNPRRSRELLDSVVGSEE